MKWGWALLLIIATVIWLPHTPPGAHALILTDREADAGAGDGQSMAEGVRSAYAEAPFPTAPPLRLRCCPPSNSDYFTTQ